MFGTPDGERSRSGLYGKIKKFSLAHVGTGKCSPLKSTGQLLQLPPLGGLDSLSSAVPAACNGHVIGFKFSLPWHGECNHHLIGFNVLVAVAPCQVSNGRQHRLRQLPCGRVPFQDFAKASRSQWAKAERPNLEKEGGENI
jgi:hypothetical protein